MLKIAWLSDLHFAATGLVSGYDPRVRLNAAINLINTQYQDCDFCVISGDLVNEELQYNYQALSAKLINLTVPFFPMVGNHDDRAMLRSTLPVPGNCMTDFVQYSIDTPGAQVLCLDTHKPGSSAGEFCSRRINWLQHHLEEAGDRPVVVFLHHPPMVLGLPLFDEIMLEQGGKLMNLLKQYSCVKHLFVGHVHRPICGVAGGIPYAAMRSLAFQAPASRPEWDWDSFAPSQEAPAMGIVSICGSDITVQYTQVCEHQLGVSG